MLWIAVHAQTHLLLYNTIQQEEEGIYVLNVTLMRVRITIVPMQNHYILHIVFVAFVI